jgi:hypothetical protein
MKPCNRVNVKKCGKNVGINPVSNMLRLLHYRLQVLARAD